VIIGRPFSTATSGTCSTAKVDSRTSVRRSAYTRMTDNDEWPHEAAKVLERLWGFRVRSGEFVIQPGVFSCLACGITQSFDAGERAGACVRHATRSEWVWRAGDEK